MKKKLFLSSILLCSLFIGCTGLEFIVAPLVGIGVEWYKNEAHKYYNHNSDIVYRATKRACKDMDFFIISDEIEEDGNFFIKAGNKSYFKIKIKKIEENVSKVSIRVDTMGDKPYAELIYKRIDDELNVIVFNDQGMPVKFIRNNF
jgi:hypothetical protein